MVDHLCPLSEQIVFVSPPKLIDLRDEEEIGLIASALCTTFFLSRLFLSL